MTLRTDLIQLADDYIGQSTNVMSVEADAQAVTFRYIDTDRPGSWERSQTLPLDSSPIGQDRAAPIYEALAAERDFYPQQSQKQVVVGFDGSRSGDLAMVTVDGSGFALLKGADQP